MKKYIILSLSIVLCLASCKRDFEEPNPNAVTIASFWKTSDDAVKGINAVYSTFKRTNTTYSRFMFYHGILKSDEGYGSGGDGGLNNLMRFNQTDYNTSLTAGTWANLFVGVFRANQVIANVPNISMDPVLKARVIGEAKFLRALFYFNLTLYYGIPPLILEPSQPGDQSPSATTAQAYAQVAKDLNEAIPSLPTAYTGLDLGRATKGAAYALLGKTYLQQNKYQPALDAFSWLVTGLGSSIYNLTANYRDNFIVAKENNVESVFEIQFSENLLESTDDDTDESRQNNTGTSIAQFFAPQPVGFGDGGARRWLVNEFLQEKTTTNAQDPRLAASLLFDFADPAGPGATQVYGQSWQARYGLNNKNVYFRKLLNDSYKNGEGFRSPNNYRMIRYADVLLMYAECLNGLDRTGEAYPYVDRVRARAGLATLTIAKPGLNKVDFLTQLKHERVTEMCGEAWRWADLLRWGDLSPALASRDADFATFVVGKNEYYPIPQNDRDLNPNLGQNPNF
ncbi:RagB/SusD family nutrient uptake outer membrane protein [Pedobacter changchengzhani]|uniref:RagB/SusD family nutrient uptake outer membrane protein n=1 Tax=Pedobacter changchengzhani TaxID=2529274 RepID=A0A4R5MND8_9SPHI|nr:RagB/SusD family nutrient uptake outer membrane protein [Pedobacter changchengzhani]TDG37272.1 RagB/SusD family nutrient uptake outer membrane protein [Pedobacter changchengzhani]